MSALNTSIATADRIRPGFASSDSRALEQRSMRLLNSSPKGGQHRRVALSRQEPAMMRRAARPMRVPVRDTVRKSALRAVRTGTFFPV